MLLSDFLTLEVYFSNQDSAQFFEDMTHKYGVPAIQKAITAGELICKPIAIGPDTGRNLLFLSEKGRQKAKLQASAGMLASF